MTNLIAQGMATLAGKMRDHAGVEVTYWHRGRKLELTAIPGRTEFPSVGDDGGAVFVESRDFIFAAGDLELGGARFTPERGDEIVETLTDGTKRVCTLLELPGIQPTRIDPNGTTVRVHTKVSVRR